MTYKLPFGLTTKPTRKYFPNGSLAFMIINGELRFKVTKTTKTMKQPLFSGKVKSKEQLDKLLNAESLSEIQTIEVVA